jgi:hypothetical protein
MIEMSIDQRSGGGDRLVPLTPFAIAFALIISMMSPREEWLYVAAVIGVLASLAVGRTSGLRRDGSLPTGVWRFAKGWLVVVLVAGLSMLHGKWQPMLFFILVGFVSTALFWLGCKFSTT